MSNFVQRLLLFTIGLPLLVFLIIALRDFGHIGWIALVLVFTFLGSYESLELFAPGFRSARRHLLPLFAMLLPLSTLIPQGVAGHGDALLTVLTGALILLLTLELLRWDPQNPPLFLRNSLGIAAALLYPGLLMSYPLRFLAFQHTVPAILLYLLLNFGNDTFAYLFGMVLGRYSKKIVPVSPRKTRIGFIGGFIGALIVGVSFFFIYPPLFRYGLYASIPFFLLIALLADIGDLVESAFKRGAAKKDSGHLMPGRGGLLDSLDSLLFSAPFFYYIGTILLN